jgi:dihydroorotase-like cyclic amidohydrolase
MAAGCQTAWSIMMDTEHNIVTDVTLQDWYRFHYEKCLRKYGPESVITRGYKEVLERLHNGDVEEKSLQEHYPSSYSLPRDTGD